MREGVALALVIMALVSGEALVSGAASAAGPEGARGRERAGALSAAEESALKPKDQFKECDNGCPEMVVVPAGSLTMGSPESEAGRGDDEARNME
ncbi:MAG: hypothetical protein FWD68_20010 [Alphaproteobacteria bacterium]|nr:hypothetical protein [Alphaproteobacteria bacterium]